MQHAPISRARYMQENRKMRFQEAYEGWSEGRLTQAEAALLLGQCERSFRRHIERFQADGLEGLLDKRLSQISKRRASGAEVDQAVHLYKSSFAGWNVAHFHSKYKSEFAGWRSYSWLKSVLQGAGVVPSAKRRGKHRIKRERMPLAGMMIHQDASTHHWVPNAVWDLVVTLDDATSEHTSMFFCDQEGTNSSFHGLGQTMARYGLFASLYSDRGSHYFTTPQAGGKVDDHLDGPGRVIGHFHVPHAEDLEDQSQEERIARQPDERQMVRLIQRIGMMDKQVLGDSSVDGAVSIKLRIDQYEEQAQRSARQQGQSHAPVGQCSPGHGLARE